MNHYSCHHVSVTKTRGERDSDCVQFFPHNTPLPYKSSADNAIIAARELAYALQNPAPQAPFSNIGKSQSVAIETLSKIFTEADDDGKSTTDLTHKPTDHTDASIPQTPQPGRTEYIPTPQINVIEYEEGVRPANCQHKVNRSPSGQHTITPGRWFFHRILLLDLMNDIYVIFTVLTTNIMVSSMETFLFNIGEIYKVVVSRSF